jgi:hypothetical protein
LQIDIRAVYDPCSAAPFCFHEIDWPFSTITPSFQNQIRPH